MSPISRMPDRPIIVRRGGSWMLLVLALAALGLAVLAAVTGRRGALRPITLTAGRLQHTRSVVAGLLLDAARAHGVHGRLVETDGAVEAIARVSAGTIDLALVPGALRLANHPHVREVAPLYFEALHLLVREPLAGDVRGSLGALAGHSVNLGAPESGSARLGVAVLKFAGLAVGDGVTPGTVVAHTLPPAVLTARAEGPESDRLPDAVLELDTLPSSVVRALVRHAGYVLVPLPFGAAFALSALAEEETHAGASPPAAEIQREYVLDTVIPPLAYRTDPPMPAEPLPTLGTRLLLVANTEVDGETVSRLLDAIFSTRFARIAHPPLERSLLTLTPEVPLHPGTEAYLARDKPLVTNDAVDELSNFLSIAGALLGASVFLWQWYRRRAEGQRDAAFGAYVLRVAAVEQRAADLELSATLELEPLLALQHDLVRLKGEALDAFAAGTLGDQELLSDFLGHVSAAREYLASLILHVRDTLEERAEAEGRSAQSLWNEAVRRSAPRGKDSA